MMCNRPPVSSQSSTFRAIAAASAAVGWPGSPSRSLTAPSCIAPFPLREGSSQCSATTSRSAPASVSAFRIRLPSDTGLPSSLIATQARLGQLAQRRQSLSAPPRRRAAHGQDAHPCVLRHAFQQCLDRGRTVGRRVRVRHRADRCETTPAAPPPSPSRSCPSARSRVLAGGRAGRRIPASRCTPAASTTSAPSVSSPPPTARTTPSSMSTLPCSSRPRRWVDDPSAPDQDRAHRRLAVAIR